MVPFFCHVYSTLTMIRLNLTRSRKKRFAMSSSTLWIIVAVDVGEKMIFINYLKIWQRQTQSDMFIFGAIETLFLKFATHNWHLFVFSLSLCVLFSPNLFSNRFFFSECKILSFEFATCRCWIGLLLLSMLLYSHLGMTSIA